MQPTSMAGQKTGRSARLPTYAETLHRKLCTSFDPTNAEKKSS
jgi:hypothetical protein